MKRSINACLLLTVSVFCMVYIYNPEPAEAGLMNETIDWVHYYDGGATPWSGSFIAGVTDSYLEQILRFSANDTQLIITFISTNNEPWQIDDTGAISLDQPPLFIETGLLFTLNNVFINSVSIYSSNMTNFGESRITMDGHNIAIDWAGSYYRNGTEIVLNVETRNEIAVPEPGSILLFVSGLAAVFAGRKVYKR